MTKCELSPLAVHVDFEKALVNAVRSQFPNAMIVGCYFHFKQAIFRCLKKTHIHTEQVKMAMESNCIDLLTIVPKKEIVKCGIPYLKMVIKSMPDFKESDVKKWDGVWVCFQRFWYSDESLVATWNIHDKKTNGHPGIHNCTKNGLER